ncbi:MAG: Gfo/Idh/MocA family oxidoreductase [Gemmatimonadetes bacterium]|jgi:predicted dehydrogenase|nr:Gfo/Idh/MocA family oxidoreductase [Gemmatimonadota bacterium]
MLNIGIVGAENSHTAAIAKVINVDKRVPGVRVTHVWGETRAYARKAAEAGEIPHIVKEPVDMVGQVDAAAVDHRHGKLHLPAAAPLLEAKMPLFIDKPFCYRVAEGKRFLDRAAELGVPVCSFSTLPKQASFKELQKQVRKLGEIYAVVSTGPCDIKSKWGGIFFYGIHQVDMVMRLLGCDISHVEAVKGAKKNHSANLIYRNGTMAAMNLVGGGSAPFHLSVIGEKGRVDQPITSDESSYLTGIREFCRMFKTGKTKETPEIMLGPVAVLQALEKAIDRKARVKVTL